MNYADFEYYTTTYGGTVFESANLFNRYSFKASKLIDRATMNRVADDETLWALNEVKQCACDLAEYLYKVDSYTNENIRTNETTAASGAVKGITSGSESINYDTSAHSSAVTNGAADDSVKRKHIYEIISTYLHGISDSHGAYILYWGLD